MKDDVHTIHRAAPLRRLWLLFAQVVTVALALYFVVATMRPDWLAHTPVQVPVGPGARAVPVLQAPSGAPTASYREAAGRASPAVVNILTSKASREAHPILKDPFFRRFSATARRPTSRCRAWVPASSSAPKVIS